MDCSPTEQEQEALKQAEVEMAADCEIDGTNYERYLSMTSAIIA